MTGKLKIIYSPAGRAAEYAELAANEPNAAPTSERIAALKKAHEMGIHTWVSLEPVWTPANTRVLIQRTHEFVDLFKVGKLNYHPHQKEVDWKRFAVEIVELLDSLGANYYIKDDLKRYL